MLFVAARKTVLSPVFRLDDHHTEANRYPHFVDDDDFIGFGTFMYDKMLTTLMVFVFFVVVAVVVVPAFVTILLWWLYFSFL